MFRKSANLIKFLLKKADLESLKLKLLLIRFSSVLKRYSLNNRIINNKFMNSLFFFRIYVARIKYIIEVA